MDPQLQQNLGQLGGLILTPIGVGKLGSAFSKIRAGRRAAQAARQTEQSAAEGGEGAGGEGASGTAGGGAGGEGAGGAGAGAGGEGAGAGAGGAGAGGEGAGGAGAGEGGAGGAGAGEGAADGAAEGLGTAGADFEVAADTDLALGGPENPVADIAAGVVALGLGIFSVFEGSNTSKPKSPPPPPPPENVTLQTGISAAEV